MMIFSDRAALLRLISDSGMLDNEMIRQRTFKSVRYSSWYLIRQIRIVFGLVNECAG